MARCFPSRCQPKKFISVRVELSFCEGMVVTYVDETGKEFRGALMSHEARYSTHNVVWLITNANLELGH